MRRLTRQFGQRMPCAIGQWPARVAVAVCALLAVCCQPQAVPSQRDQAPTAADKHEPLPAAKSAVQIHIRGPITPLTTFTLQRRLDEARERNPDLLIVEIDSPGGYLSESLECATLLRDVDWARTVAYVPKKALSGAAMISLGCDDIILDPHARLGDVGVIGRGGANDAFRYVPEKIVSDVVAEMRALAIAKGRPPALAEAMVDKNIEVFHVENTTTGQKKYMTEKEIDADNAGGQVVWKKLKKVPEAQKDRFLDVLGPRAVELGLAQGLASDEQQLEQLYSLPKPPVELPNTWIDTTIYTLNQPWATGLLFLVGLIAMYVEFNMPGIGLGGALALLCFALYFWSHWLGGTAAVLEIVLCLAGLAFIALEIFVIPGFGVTGILGALLIGASFLMANQRGVLPETHYDLIRLRDHLAALVVSGFVFTVFAVLTRKRFGSRSLFSRLVLEPPGPEADDAQAEEAQAGAAKSSAASAAPASSESEVPARQPLLNARGRTVTALRPAGKALVNGRYLDVVAADGEFISVGQPIEVVETHGNRIVVRECRDSA